MTGSFRRFLGLFASFAVAGGASLLLGGCATTIVPPDSVDRPQSVFVLDHGRHSSLVLPHPDGFVRYAYGDWGWYAEVDTGPAEALRAVFWPTRAGLGRRQTDRPATREGLREGLRVGIQEIHAVEVDADRVTALRDSLEARHRENLSSVKYNATYDLAFVEYPEAYAFWHNSNHKVADWLRRLGCTIEGTAFWAWWEVKGAGEVEELTESDRRPFDEPGRKGGGPERSARTGGRRSSLSRRRSRRLPARCMTRGSPRAFTMEWPIRCMENS